MFRVHDLLHADDFPPLHLTYSPIQPALDAGCKARMCHFNKPNFPNMREYIKKIMLAWSQGKQHASSGCGCSYSGKQSMTLEGNTIWSYSTPIAHIKDGVMHLNTEKYSVTTTRQQSGLLNISGQYGLRVVKCTEKEVRTLWANS